MTPDHRHEHRPDRFSEWVYAHPWTCLYVAIVVTVLLVLNVYQVAHPS